MTNLLKKIEALKDEDIELLIEEYIKRHGIFFVNYKIAMMLTPSKLKIPNVRQFIPYSPDKQMEEANSYLRKHLSEIYEHLEESTTSV